MGQFLIILLSVFSVSSFAGEFDPQPLHTSEAPWYMDFLGYDKLDSRYDGQGVTIAIIDSGIDESQPSLKGKLWTNEGEIPGNGLDDDGDGYTDDVHGVNFIFPENPPNDLFGHGTNLAGIIAADYDENVKTHGIARSVQIMPLKVINTSMELADNPKEFLLLTSMAKALHYAVDHKAQIIVVSWRLYKNDPDFKPFLTKDGIAQLREAFQYADNNNVIVVAAAGNERGNLDDDMSVSPMYPVGLGNFKNMVVVGSSTMGSTRFSSIRKDTNGESRAEFSNYGTKWVDVVAPGEGLVSTGLVGRWEMVGGTSMSAPLVAGLLARGLSKGYTSQQAIEKLYSSSVQDEYWSQYCKHGRVDPVKFLAD